MYLYTYDDINKEITSYGIADGMTKAEMKEAKRNGFLFTDREIIDDFQGHLYFEDELSEDKLNEINQFLLNVAKDNKIDEFKLIRLDKERTPVIVNGMSFDIDEKSIERIRNAIAIGDKVIWTLSDNTSAEIDSEVLTDVLKAVAIQANNVHNEYLVMKEKINACTSKEELENIVWN